MPKADNLGGVGATRVRGLTDATHVTTSFWLARTLSVLGPPHAPVMLSPGRSTSNLPGCAVVEAVRFDTAFAASYAHCLAW